MFYSYIELIDELSILDLVEIEIVLSLVGIPFLMFPAVARNILALGTSCALGSCIYLSSLIPCQVSSNDDICSKILLFLCSSEYTMYY